MKKINDVLINWQVKAYCALTNFKNSERGDTNFISMLLIIGIVVVLAGLFLTFGKTIINAIMNKVNAFIATL